MHCRGNALGNRAPGCAATLTCGRLGPGPAHQVGLSDCRLLSIHFAPEPPYPHRVVIGTGSNLPAERGGLHRNQISATAHQGSSASQQGERGEGGGAMRLQKF